MRLICYALLALMLAACASTSPDTANTAARDPATHTPVPRASIGTRTIDVDKDAVQAAAGDANVDLWGRIRKGFQIPDLDGDLVDTQLNWYTTRPDYVQRMTERSKRYLYHIVEELDSRHMPTELALLPYVESAFNPQALSVAKAAGMWQFVPGTGRDYNLRQNMFRDERRDVLASTSAALDYLSRLHDMFGDWYLALAAYNWGEGNVQRAIARNAAAGLPTDYLSLKMPSETRNYVPKLQAVKNIIANPTMYGLTLPDVPNHPYFITVTTARDIDVSVAARLARLPLDDFRALNPSFARPVILGATQPQILLPFDNAEIFQKNLKAYTEPLSSWTTYTVTQRERPAALAERIGVDVDTLTSVNKIPAGMRLKPGSTVLVPKSDDADTVEDISADVAENAVLAVEPDLPDTRKMLVRIRRTQTMEMLANRYGVSVGQIQAWNRTRRTTVAAGQRVVLHVPFGKAIPVEPGPDPVHVAATRGTKSFGAAAPRSRAAGPAAAAKTAMAPAKAKGGKVAARVARAPFEGRVAGAAKSASASRKAGSQDVTRQAAR
jgi:membrane-bound lytic murein transglycosylase D